MPLAAHREDQQTLWDAQIAADLDWPTLLADLDALERGNDEPNPDVWDIAA